MAVIGITVITGNYIPAFLFEIESSPLAIFPLTEFYDTDKVFNTPPEVFFKNIFLFIKPISIQIFYMIMIFGLSYLIYKRKPGKIIASNDLSEIRDDTVRQQLEKLRVKAGIDQQVKYFENGKIRDFSAQVFGTGNDLYLKAGRGLLKIMPSKNYGLFESIILHEFSHIKNKDIPKTYFAESVLKIPFMITIITMCLVMFFALIKNIAGKIISGEFTFILLFEKTALYLNLFAQVIFLVLILFLLFRMLIRSREYYADLRAASLTDPGLIKKYFERISKKEIKENLIVKIFGYHPSLKFRSEMLAEPVKIFRPSYKVLFVSNLVSYIFVSLAFIYGISFLLLIVTLAGYSLLYLLQGILNQILHLGLVYVVMIIGTLLMAVFLIICGNIIRNSFFHQIDKILITQKYNGVKIPFVNEIIKLSLSGSAGIICGYLLLPLYGFNILQMKNLLSVPFVFILTFTGFFLLNLFHYFWMDHKINNEYSVDYSVPIFLRLFEGIFIMIIFLSAMLSFLFFISLFIS